MCHRWRHIVHSSPRFWGQLTLPLGAESEQPAAAQLPAGLLCTQALQIMLLPLELPGPCQLGTLVSRLTHLQQLHIWADASDPLVVPADLWAALLSLPELRALDAAILHSVPPQPVAALTRLTRLRLSAGRTHRGLCAALAGLPALRDLDLTVTTLGDCAADGNHFLSTLTCLSALTALRLQLGSGFHSLPPPGAFSNLQRFDFWCWDGDTSGEHTCLEVGNPAGRQPL